MRTREDIEAAQATKGVLLTQAETETPAPGQMWGGQFSLESGRTVVAPFEIEVNGKLFQRDTVSDVSEFTWLTARVDGKRYSIYATQDGELVVDAIGPTFQESRAGLYHTNGLYRYLGSFYLSGWEHTDVRSAASEFIGGMRVSGGTLVVDTGGDIVAGNVRLAAEGVITVGTGNDVAIISADDEVYRLWIGSATAADAPFRVTFTGDLVATSVDISGTVGGIVAGFSAESETGFYAGTGTARVQMSPGDGFWCGATVQADAPFRVTAAGALTATSATITGAVTATSGTIGGFTVNATDGLYAGTGATRVQMKAGAGFWAGATLQASAPFSVTEAGVLSATSGTIGGWTIGESTLSATNITLDASNARIYIGASNQLRGDATKNRWSVHDSSGTEKVSIGFFDSSLLDPEGYPYTTNDYGLYVAGGNKVIIQSQVDVGGANLVARDGSLIIAGSSGYNLLKVGTESGIVGYHHYETVGAHTCVASTYLESNVYYVIDIESGVLILRKDGTSEIARFYELGGGLFLRTDVLKIDSAADIFLDADSGAVYLEDNNSAFGAFKNSGGQLQIYSGDPPVLALTFSGANATFAGTLGVTGVATFTAQPVLSSLTASQAVFTDASKGLVSNAITGTGNVVMSASPTLSGTITAAAANFSEAVGVDGNFDVNTSKFFVNATTGNISVGTTDIEAWGGGYGAIEFPSSAIMFHTTASSVHRVTNAYYDGAWKRKAASYLCTDIYQSSTGQVYIGQASAGTADSSFSWIYPFLVSAGALSGALSLDAAGVDMAGTLDVVGQFTVGGGYGSTGVTISSAGAISADASITINADQNLGMYESGTGRALARYVSAENRYEILTRNTAGTDWLDRLYITGEVDAGSVDVVNASFTVGGGYGSTGVTISSAGAISADGALTVGAANLLVDTDTLYVDAANDRVGINKTPTVAFDVSGAALFDSTVGISGTATTRSIVPAADDTYDLGSAAAKWKDIYIDGTANIDALVAATADINGGTIDGVTIGGSSAAAATVTTLTPSTVVLPSNSFTFSDASSDRTVDVDLVCISWNSGTTQDELFGLLDTYLSTISAGDSCMAWGRLGSQIIENVERDSATIYKLWRGNFTAFESIEDGSSDLVGSFGFVLFATDGRAS